MSRLALASFGSILLLICPSASSAATAAPPSSDSADVIVYGGTSAGVIAAAEVARLGKTVILIEPGKRLGGMTTGGMGIVDVGGSTAMGGLTREFFRRVGQHYGMADGWCYEPHIAEQVMEQFVADKNIKVVRGERIVLGASVADDGVVRVIRLESGRKFSGKMFIDATYEGDLLAVAKVNYTLGRESNSQYGESHDGVQVGEKGHEFKVKLDPYVKPGDPTSGLLPGIHAGGPGVNGEGDRRIQAYNFRMCLTNAPENRLPFPKPAGYNPLRYELWLRNAQAGVFDMFGLSVPMPNHKNDVNNSSPVSTDDIGMNYDYPEGNYATRERIYQEHVTYQQGLMWFAANDPRVPKKFHDEMSQWGLPKDEFTDNGGWPTQLYVREARRMIGDYVIAEADCLGKRVAEDSVGLGSYTMDSHHTQLFVKDGHAFAEGNVEISVPGPYPISYRAIVPGHRDVDNLLVPVCLSSTHMGYGSIRMEPVYMILAQSAAAAACQAIDEKCGVREIDVKKLQALLEKEGQVLAWPPKPGSEFANAVRDGKQLQGVWKAKSLVIDGKPASKDALERMKFDIRKERLRVVGFNDDATEDRGWYTLGANLSPRQFDFTGTNHRQLAAGIYELKGDELRVCIRHSTSGVARRPTDFSAGPGSRAMSIVFERAD